MSDILKTVFHERHIGLGAKMMEFGGWDMPVNYPAGIVQEHLKTRKKAGLFDVSHMGRFTIGGKDALAFLQKALTNNANALTVMASQYTIIADENGCAIDDAYLYRFKENEYLLVVNASNKDKDLVHLKTVASEYDDAVINDITGELVMLSLQGPLSKSILLEVINKGTLPIPEKNKLSVAAISGVDVYLSRTGYTGEPLGFELFMEKKDGPAVWDLLIEKGAVPVGLGARDTLRLEAGLPLYGHELGNDPEGKEIPIFTLPLASIAVSFNESKNGFIGEASLAKQFETHKRIIMGDFSDISALPNRIFNIALMDKGIARAGAKVFYNDECVGYVTSGTSVPYWKPEGESIMQRPGEETDKRSIGMAILKSSIKSGMAVEIDVRDKRLAAKIVPYNMRNGAPPFARPIIHNITVPKTEKAPENSIHKRIGALLEKSIENTRWRQGECINLIPSEQSMSSMVKRLSILDPAGRYAEHNKSSAFGFAEIFYYQGTDFIAEVEALVIEEFKKYLSCASVEPRAISGQMANTVIFSALVDYVNRFNKSNERLRIPKVMNHHIRSGGHLSAQPMGALRDYVARDTGLEKPSVVNFPVLEENPYKTDIEKCRRLIEENQPTIAILGKSMIIHKEPVKEIKALVDELSPDTLVMYDMAHVLGLYGPYFQEPFKEGADIVTGSTHKTFFGTQRGVAACNIKKGHKHYPLWSRIARRAFPGSVSNHHLGTLLGLLMAAYEMNHFKDAYQKNVIQNAKAFAKALADTGLTIAGDPEVSFTETHQVILNVGYAKGPEIAKKLEENNIIVNYQATSEEEGFTASGSIRMGVSEMTRFGMEGKDFETLAQLFHDIIASGKNVKQEITELRKRFLKMQYCFAESEFDGLMEQIHSLI